MNTLREAATQALEALEGGADSWERVGPAIDALRAALVEDAMQKFTDVNQELEAALGCEHCNQALYAAVKCRVCGRVTSAKPVQEPVAWIDDSGHPKHLSHLQSATERRLYGPLRPLYTTPPPAEPAQEQPVCDECGKHKRDGWALYCVKCVEPMFSPPQRPAESVQEPQCNPHPKAPHGFLRNASHNENRYVCECEGWEPYEAGYQAGMEAALRAQS